MEHPCESCLTFGLLGECSDPSLGFHFVHVQMKELLVLVHLCFFHDVVVHEPTPKLASTVRKSLRCFGFAGQRHCSPSLWCGGHSGALSTIVATSTVPSTGWSRNRTATSPAHFNPGCSADNHVESIEVSSWAARCGSPAGFVNGTTVFVGFRDKPSSQRITKEEGEDVNCCRSARTKPMPQLSAGLSRHPLPKPLCYKKQRCHERCSGREKS